MSVIDDLIFSKRRVELPFPKACLEWAVVGLAILKLDLLLNLVGVPAKSIIKILNKISIIELIEGGEE